MKRSLAFVCGMLFASLALAQTGQISYEDATALGGQVGSSLNPSVTRGITTQGGQDTVPTYGADPSQKQYFQGGIQTPVGPGTDRVAGCTGQDDLECQAVNLMKQGPLTRPQFDLKNDPLVARAKALNKNPTSVTGDIFTSYETCTKSIRELAPVFETQICNEFAFTEDKTCSMGQNVVIDPDYIYKCIETIQSQANATCTLGRVVNVDAKYNYQCDTNQGQLNNYTCNKILVVQCEGQGGGNCANSGIVPGSVGITNGTYSFTFDGTTMTLINTITAVNSVTQATFAFQITGKERIQNFRITAMHSDNWVGLRVNGVYIGTHSRAFGGFNTSSDRLEMSGMQVYYAPGQWSSPEQGINFYSAVDFDLRPYLVEGQNFINMYVVNGGGAGYGRVYITAQQYCARNCWDTWDNQCASFEQRAQ